MSDVFVSYKAEDRPRVQPLVDALESDGLSVWWDARVGGGDAWRETIAEQLDSAPCVIVVWSKRSTAPEGRFVRDEAARAQRHGSYLPVTIDKVDPPLGFGEVQALPLSGWKGDRSDPRYRSVSECVHSILQREPTIASSARFKTRPSRRAVLAGGGVAAIAAATGGWLLLRPARAKAHTIAVLPFANLSGDASQNYFSDGMAEELRSALAAVGGLQVVARTSSEVLRNVDAITAARRLDVADVITGSVRRSPTTVRVSAQLVDGRSGIEQWSQSFDRPFGDVLAIQSDIAANVAQALSVELGSTARAALSKRGTNSPEAQDLLLRATAAHGDDSEQGMLGTIALLERAIELDPAYAEAHAKRGQYLEIWASTFAHNVKEKEQGQSQAIQSARRAIAIAPQLPSGYAALGAVHQDQLQLKRSLADFERAGALPGTDVLALLNYALVLSQARRQPEALSATDRAITLDPLNPISQEIQSWILFYGRRYEASIDAARQALKISPGRNRANAFIGNGLLMLGRPDEALRQYREVPADDYHRMVGEAAIAARAGRREDALKAIPAIERRYADAALYQFAEVYAQLGLIDQGVAALEAAWAKRDPGLAAVQVDPFLDPLRKDGRVAAIAARVFG
jgi:TolB-like protein/Tfp pilus assembly protein PilF